MLLEDSKKSLSYICFFNKAFIWTIYKKSFRFGRLTLSYVVCFVSVYTISCCLQCRVLVTFAYARTILYFCYVYLPLKAIRFFCCRILKG